MVVSAAASATSGASTTGSDDVGVGVAGATSAGDAGEAGAACSAGAGGSSVPSSAAAMARPNDGFASATKRAVSSVEAGGCELVLRFRLFAGLAGRLRAALRGPALALLARFVVVFLGGPAMLSPRTALEQRRDVAMLSMIVTVAPPTRR